MSYIGVPPFGQTVRTITELTASAGQTTFNVSGGYLPGYVDVFLNGVSLASGDFTSTNGSTVVLGAAASLNDEFKAIAYWPVSLIDTYRKSEADALLATKQAASPTLTTYASTGIGFRNRIINGDMRIDQRNNGASVNPTDGQFVVDRFAMGVSQTSKLTAQRSAVAPVGFANSILVTSSSAYSVSAGDYFAVNQSVEGFNVADLGWGTTNAQAVTLSFWVRSSLTGTFAGSLRNSASNRSYPFSYTIIAANTWEQKTVTIAGDTSGTWVTDNGIGIKVWFAFGVGSTYTGTAGAWVAGNFVSATGATSVVGTNGATFYITGVQLEAGTVASPFERRDYGRELIMCQRYYSSNFNVGSPVSQGSASDNRCTIGTIFNSTELQAAPLAFPVAMRTAPTITFYRPSFIATDGNWGVFPLYWGGSGFAPTLISVTNLRLVVGGTSIAGGTNYSSYIMSGYYAASAEL